MSFNTLTEISHALKNGDVSSVEVTQHYLERAKKLNTTINAFITLCEEQAIAAAERADKKRAEGKATTITGVPIAWKDIFCTEGILTSCASKMLESFVSPYSAHAVKLYEEAGAIMLGKTNMDEFAMGTANENSYFGRAKNPWKLEHITGGSSGGSAAAVAADLAPGAIGTDTGGSIRQPAALCGITGIKPTYGSISRYGMIAFASSLDQGGPMARSAEDCALMLNHLIGFDPKDSTSIQRPENEDYQHTLNHSLKGKKIGLLKGSFDQLSPEASDCFEKAKRTLASLGCEFIDIECPHFEYAVATYYVLAPAECSSNLARYDGVHYGHRAENPVDLDDLYKRSRSEGFGEEVKRRILIGTHVLSSGYYDACYSKAQKVRRLMMNDFTQAFSHVDVLMTPTYPGPAIKSGGYADPLSAYLSDLYTIPASLAGLPGLSMPVGFVDGLPLGAQLIAPAYSESLLLNVAHQYQQETDWHIARSQIISEG